MPTITTQVKTAVKLSPTLKMKVSASLKAYESLKVQRDALTAELDRLKSVMTEAFEQAKQGPALDAGVKFPGGYTLKTVTSVSSTLDRKLLIDAGCTEEILDECTVRRPRKPYLKVTTPSDRKETDE